MPDRDDDLILSHFIDLRVRRDAEVTEQVVLDALFSRVHRNLARLGSRSIGVSFPGYSVTPRSLGTTVRLIGPRTELQQFAEGAWLGSVRDHVEVAALREVPAGAPPRSLRRVQVKSSPERLVRRQARRHGLDEGAVRVRYAGLRAEQSRLPFLTIASASTGQRFRLILALGELAPRAIDGEFNAYGLSPTATIPWF